MELNLIKSVGKFLFSFLLPQKLNRRTNVVLAYNRWLHDTALFVDLARQVPCEVVLTGWRQLHDHLDREVDRRSTINVLSRGELPVTDVPERCEVDVVHLGNLCVGTHGVVDVLHGLLAFSHCGSGCGCSTV